jgi:Tol biopolymer transport system component
MSKPARKGVPPSVPTLANVVVSLALSCLVACGGRSPQTSLTTGVPTAIAFTSNRALDGSDASNNGVWNIWAINSDGSGAAPLTQLTTLAYPAQNQSPMWSPDGTKVVYSSGGALDGSNGANGAYGTLNIWVMNADGSGSKPLTQVTAAQMDCHAPVWSPDGSKIAYFSQRALDGSDTMSSNPNNIWIMNSDGSNASPLTQMTAYAADSYYPLWSPKGTQLAVFSSRALDGSNAANGSEPYTWNIWILQADGSGALPITQRTNTLADSQDPFWSKDGTTLVFSTGGNIWTAHADGSGLTNLTNLNNSISFVAGWSPDGSKLTFVSNRTLDGTDNLQEKTNVWIMNVDGSNPAPLTKLTNVGADGGTWSPDGTRIAYFSPRAFDGSDAGDAGGTTNLWLVKPDGSGSTPLTKLSAAISTGPEWHP